MPTIWSYLDGSAKYARWAERIVPGMGWQGERLEGNSFLVMGYCLPNAVESLDIEEVVNVVYEQLSSEYRLPFRVGVIDMRGSLLETWLRDWTVSGAVITS
jgi:hypothetical protein